MSYNVPQCHEFLELILLNYRTVILVSFEQFRRFYIYFFPTEKKRDCSTLIFQYIDFSVFNFPRLHSSLIWANVTQNVTQNLS